MSATTARENNNENASSSPQSLSQRRTTTVISIEQRALVPRSRIAKLEADILRDPNEALLAQHRNFVLQEQKKFRKLAKAAKFIHCTEMVPQKERITRALMGVAKDCDRIQMARLERLRTKCFEKLDAYDNFAAFFLDNIVPELEDILQEYLARMKHFKACEDEFQELRAVFHTINETHDMYRDHMRDFVTYDEELGRAIAQAKSRSTKRSQHDAATNEKPHKRQRIACSFYHYR